MKRSLTIGEFSRATHLSLKTLRYYHRIGLLEPASVHATTAYRHYAIEQIATAQVIRRFRDLDVPVEEVRALLAASVEERAGLLAAHRQRLEEELARTQVSLTSLEELTAPSRAPELAIELRTAPELRVVAIREVVKLADLEAWFRAAITKLDAPPTGPLGALVEERFFTEEEGELTIFLPTRDGTTRIAGAELAVIRHLGDHRDIDRSYGALGAYVAQNELKVDGPLRETYLLGRRETSDSSKWITEIGWPIFRTRA